MGRKWTVQEAVDEATSRFKYKDIVGKVCTGRQGLGFGEAHHRWDTVECKKKRKMVTDELRNVEEERRSGWSSWSGIARSLDEVGERSTHEDNLENVMENGAHTNPVHHPLDVRPITDIDKSHAMGRD